MSNFLILIQVGYCINNASNSFDFGKVADSCLAGMSIPVYCHINLQL